MSRLLLPLTVRRPGGPVDLLLHAAGPMPWARVEPAVLRAAGLPADTALYRGVGRVEPTWLVGSPPLLAGCVLGTAPERSLPEDPTVLLAVIAGPDAGRQLPMGSAPVTVGRDPAADLPLTDPQSSFRHALLRPLPTGLAVTDLGSTNGVFVDGVAAADSAPAGTGSLIRIGGSLLQVQLAAEPADALTPDGAGHLIRAASPPPPADDLPPVPAAPTPPPHRPRRSIPLLSAVLGAAVGGTLALVLDSPIYLAFAALGPVTMLGSAISDRIGGRRSRRREWAQYRAAVAARTDAVEAIVTADRRQAWRIWPDPATLLRRAAVGGRLWDRRPGDVGYLQLAVGSGARRTRACAGGAGATPSDGAAAASGSESGGSGPNGARSAEQVARVSVTDVPVTVDLAATPVLGLVGPGARALARWLLLQLACLHSPADVAVLLVGAGPDLLAGRDLPHVPSAGAAPRPRRGRPWPIGDPAAIGTRDTIAVLDGSDAMAAPLGRGVLAAAGQNARPDIAPADGRSGSGGAGVPRGPGSPMGRCAVLCLADAPADLPAGCTVLTAPRSTVPGADGPVDVTGIDVAQFRGACRALAPLRDGSGTGPEPPPAVVPLTDLIGPADADRLRECWRRPTPRAALGIGPTGPVTIDLDADGPHLLVAGTTGSGKSELLRTLVAALAAGCPPAALTFLLVDYKGGSAFADLTGLPHVVGVVTDLDPALSARALASLRAELRRRERLAAEGGPAPPRLVLVIDEFATLTTELPDFLAGVLDIAQRGRSLGLHLVLATQRPAGVISPAMRANIGARICLRVTDPADSVDIVGVPDAATISPRTPGRAVLRTGVGVVAFQSAHVSSPAPPEVWVQLRDGAHGGHDGHGTHEHGKHDSQVFAADIDRPAPAFTPAAGPDPVSGSVPAAPAPGPEPGPGSTEPSAVTELVRAATAAAADQPPPDRPWVPPLPSVFRPDPDRPDCLALADLPERQCRRALPLPDTSVLVTGPPGSGRSSTLRRIAGIAAARDAELLVIDATGALSDLQHWPEVSSYLDLTDPRLVLRLATLLAARARQPSDGRCRYLLLDGYDLIAGALDRVDYTTGSALLAELPARAAMPVRLVASGPPALLHQRVAAGFPTVIELDPGTETGTGAPIPGRGRWAGAAVQIAAPPDTARRRIGEHDAGEDHRDRHRDDAHHEDEHRDGERHPRGSGRPRWADALIVRPLPTLVSVGDLPAPRPDAVPLGLGGDAAAPLTLDLTGPGGAIVLAGARRSGTSTAARVLATGAAHAGIPVLQVLSGSVEAPIGVAEGAAGGVTTLDLRGGAEPLRAALADHRGPVLLVVDQSGQGDDHPAADLLERFCQACGPGQHLVLAERTDVLARAHRGHLRAALAFRRGVLLAPDAPDGALLDIPLPRRTGPAPVGRGVWAQHGHVEPVQIGWPGTG